jgi:membrane protein implicated in regulation of membrane protease activity
MKKYLAGGLFILAVGVSAISIGLSAMNRSAVSFGAVWLIVALYFLVKIVLRERKQGRSSTRTAPASNRR